MKEETNYAIVRANSLHDLDEAFSCGLINLYQDIFSDPPYEEYFSDDDVISMFRSYFEKEIETSLVLFTYLEREIIAFCMAVPLNERWLDFEIIDFNKNTSHNCHDYFKSNFNSTSENTWYLDDLGVRKDSRRRGIAKCLLQSCLTELSSKNVFLRTSDSNNKAPLLYQNLGFSSIDGIFTLVSQKRLDGSVREDRRIIMLRQAGYVD
jgi:ribosomal protein S18 acetylase RimI-like enzyme